MTKLKSKILKKIQNVIPPSQLQETFLTFKKEINKSLNKIPKYGRIERQHIMKIAFDFIAKNEINGNYLEFGCFEGRSFCYAYTAYQNMIKKGFLQEYPMYIFDSFEGLPSLSEQDKMDNYGAFNPGDYSCTLDGVKKNLIKKNVDLSKVKFVQGFYSESLKRDHDITKVSIAHIDCDLHSSAVDVLEFLTDKIQDGTLLIFDDYYCYKGNPNFGVRRALNEWLVKHNISVTEYYNYSWSGKTFIINLQE